MAASATTASPAATGMTSCTAMRVRTQSRSARAIRPSAAAVPEIHAHVQRVFGHIDSDKNFNNSTLAHTHPCKNAGSWPKQPFGLWWRKGFGAQRFPTGSESPGRNELPNPEQKNQKTENKKPGVCGFVDNSPSANRAACRGKRCAFPTAQPFAHKPHRPLFILNKFIKNDHTRR